MMSINCCYCGKFISEDDVKERKAACKYTPDSEFTTEKIEWVCKQCMKVGGIEDDR